MAERVDTGSEESIGEGKLAWVHPKIEVFRARDAEAAHISYGGSDAGFYHS
jgi:hypothetical protein